MAQTELLRRVVEVLEDTRVDYMVTGSLVSSLQGEPRSTHDIDLVVEIGIGQIAELIRRFPPPRYYLSERAALEAIDSGGVFNLLETTEGDKVDFWLLTDDPFDRSRFARRYVETVFGIPLQVSSPEDTILQKLRWVTATGGSNRSFTDALRVYEVQRDSLDRRYIADWATRLGVLDLWMRVEREAEPINSRPPGETER